MNEKELLEKRLNELEQRALNRNYITFSDFLNQDEISILKSLKHNSEYALFGGYEYAERCIAAFGENIQNQNYPIVCLKISPVKQKFADRLSHRDFLGALMNLGINRNTLGDIITENNEGYLFCNKNIANYIEQNLLRVRHTTVTCSFIDETPEFINKLPDSEEIIVSSLRADAVISGVFKLSRNETARLFNSEKVFINSKTAVKESVVLKDGDTVSLRGYGKFIFVQPIRQTKKGRTIIEIKIYK